MHYLQELIDDNVELTSDFKDLQKNIVNAI